ncbi:MAG: hypothetical protein HY308_09565 [Gammaproteobacteria bacterium]|nr:hypothetical protein [Gammaproteobacteria bacterium]
MTSWWWWARERRIYWQVRRWTLDETPMPRQLFEQVVDDLYRNNRFANGMLAIGEHRADPRCR